MDNINLQYICHSRIYFEDTDAGGVVYHGRYLAFFERARTEILRQFGYSQKILLKKQIAFAVRRLSIEYISPAVLDDEITIQTQVVELRKASIQFYQTMCNQQNKLLSEVKVVVACVDLAKMKAMKLPEDIILKFSGE